MALANQLKEANPWPAPPDKETLQKQFEQLVVKAREGQNQLHKDVVRVMDIPYEVATRVLDALADPAQALEGLRLDPKANLLTIQDELARTRIGECVRFQGISRMDLVSQCAGFVVDVKTVGLCLAGQECRPALSTNGKASAAALTLLRPVRFKDLAQANLLPRIGVNPEKFAEVFDSCAKNQPSREAAANCVLDKQLSEQQKKALQCVQRPAPGQTLVERVSCATGEQLPTDVKQSVECLQSGTGDQRIRCVAKAQMPKEMQVYAECKEEAGGDDPKLAQCVAKKKLQMPKEMQAYVECKEKAGISSGGYPRGGPHRPPAATRPQLVGPPASRHIAGTLHPGRGEARHWTSTVHRPCEWGRVAAVRTLAGYGGDACRRQWRQSVLARGIADASSAS